MNDIQQELREDLPAILSYALPCALFQERSVLSAMVMAFTQQHVPSAHIQFVNAALPLLVQLGLTHISHIDGFERYRSFPPKTLDQANPKELEAMYAFRELNAGHKELSWRIGLMETLPEAKDDTSAIIELCNTFGDTRSPSSKHAFRDEDMEKFFPIDPKKNKRAMRKPTGMHGRRTVLHLKAVLGSDVCLKIRPELAGVERMVRLLGRTLFGDDAAPFVSVFPNVH